MNIWDSKIASFATAIALPLMAVSTASAAHIDFFDAGGFRRSANPGETRTVSQNVPSGEDGALGGVRQVTVRSSFGGGINPVAAEVRPGADGEDGVLLTSFNSTGSVVLEYGGLTSAGDLNADFLNIPDADPSMQWTQLELDFSGVTGFGGASATLTSNAGAATATVLADAPSAREGGTSVFAYTDFLAQAPALDLTDIDSVSLEITGFFGSRFTLPFFGRGGSILIDGNGGGDDGGGDGSVPPNVIPSPAAMPAGLMLIAGLTLRRRRSI